MSKPDSICILAPWFKVHEGAMNPQFFTFHGFRR